MAGTEENERDVDRRISRLEDEFREHCVEAFGLRVQIVGLDASDGGRIGRLEAAMKAMQEWKGLTDRRLDAFERVVWKIMAAATMAGTATALMVKALDWVLKH